MLKAGNVGLGFSDMRIVMRFMHLHERRWVQQTMMLCRHVYVLLIDSDYMNSRSLNSLP